MRPHRPSGMHNSSTRRKVRCGRTPTLQRLQLHQQRLVVPHPVAPVLQLLACQQREMACVPASNKPSTLRRHSIQPKVATINRHTSRYPTAVSLQVLCCTAARLQLEAVLVVCDAASWQLPHHRIALPSVRWPVLSTKCPSYLRQRTPLLWRNFSRFGTKQSGKHIDVYKMLIFNVAGAAGSHTQTP